LLNFPHVQMYLEEGRRIREAAEIEKARLAHIKERKLKDLEDAGVPAKYRAELEKYKLQIKWLLRFVVHYSVTFLIIRAVTR